MSKSTVYHAVHMVDELPESPLEAAETYFANHHAETKALLQEKDTETLVVVLHPASPDHDDWRRALARDLARAYSPKRVNVVATGDGPTMMETLAYLQDAPGVTGQYLVGHD